MKQDQFRNYVVSPLEAWSHLGEFITETGTRLIGHVPHVAPKAYLHIVYAPLLLCDLEECENILGQQISQQFRDFLLLANGLDIFGGAIRLKGYIPRRRKAEVTVHNYPTSIIIPNAPGRIRGLDKFSLVIAFYTHDGSYALIDEAGRVTRFDAKGTGECICQWSDFDTWIISEIEHLSAFYGKDGKVKQAECIERE